jgi:hypothetical protein
MDPPQEYSTLLEAVGNVPDPRKARGKQHDWKVLLALTCAAIASDQKSVRAMSQWVQEHAHELLKQLQPTIARLPSASTLYRAIRAIDPTELEKHLALYTSRIEAQAQQAKQSEARCNKQKVSQLTANNYAGQEHAGGTPV